MKAAIVGGTFDPVHLGHLFLAHEVRHEMGYDTIIFIPANEPAHKRRDGGASAGQRVSMLRIAVLPWDRFLVDDCEIRRGGVSYTVDTLRDVRRRYDLEGKPGLVIGDDLAADFHRWRRAQEIPELADLIVCHRLYDTEMGLDFPHRYCPNLRLPISSSDIRDRIARGRPVEGLVPDGVLGYIRSHSLYGSAGEGPGNG